MARSLKTCESWGRYPRSSQNVRPVFWPDEILDFSHFSTSVLPYGQGRSYGDCCLNDGGTLLVTHHLDRFLGFDRAEGLLRCEAGVTLQSILRLIVPEGWFLPVTPGTQYVSLGGAIANDVHGKNHHRAGSFGSYVTQLELLRSSGERLICSHNQNPDLFAATIGGIGLTGLILWAEIRLQRKSNFLSQETIRFRGLDEFRELSKQAEPIFEHTVAWIDSASLDSPESVRGIFIRANHASTQRGAPAKKWQLKIPFVFPSALLSRFVIRAFNRAYLWRKPYRPTSSIGHYESFFYPLDHIDHWNFLYGPKGFLQFQCVIPENPRLEGIREMFRIISRYNECSAVSVLKLFGDITSSGMLSFPRPGVTLAMDFAHRGRETLKMFADLESIVLEHHGAIYPAKDATMSPKAFLQFFPRMHSFAKFIDPKFSSNFWRRVSQ